MTHTTVGAGGSIPKAPWGLNRMSWPPKPSFVASKKTTLTKATTLPKKLWPNTPHNPTAVGPVESPNLWPNSPQVTSRLTRPYKLYYNPELDPKVHPHRAY